MIIEFEKSNGSGSIHVNCHHVVAIEHGSDKGKSQITLTSGRDAVVIGDAASVAQRVREEFLRSKE